LGDFEKKGKGEHGKDDHGGTKPKKAGMASSGEKGVRKVMARVD